MNFLVETVYAMGGSSVAKGAQQPNPVGMFLPFILIFGVMYFFVLRPQKKQQKKIEQMRSDLKKGDEVVTLGGIHATVKTVAENTAQIEIAQGVIITVTKNSISAQVSKPKK